MNFSIPLLCILIVFGCKDESETRYSDLSSTIIDSTFKAKIKAFNKEYSIPFDGFFDNDLHTIPESSIPANIDVLRFCIFNTDTIGFTIIFKKNYTNSNPDAENYLLDNDDRLSFTKKNLQYLIGSGLYEQVSLSAFEKANRQGVVFQLNDLSDSELQIKLHYLPTTKTRSRLNNFLLIEELDFIDDCNAILNGEFYHADSVTTASGSFKGYIFNRNNITCLL